MDVHASNRFFNAGVTVHSYSTTSTVWSDENKGVVFGSATRNPGPGLTGRGVPDLNGLVFGFNEIAELELIEPWPWIRIEHLFLGITANYVFRPARGEEPDFELMVADIVGQARHISDARVVLGWREFPTTPFEIVADRPRRHGKSLGAFRTSSESDPDAILAEHQQPKATLVGRIFAAHEWPSSLTLTRDYLYASFDEKVHARVPVDALRNAVDDEGDVIYTFGRCTPLLVRQAADCPVAKLLDQRLAQQR